MTRECDEGLYKQGKTVKRKKEEDLKKSRFKRKLIVIYLFQYIKICFHKVNVMGHKFGMLQMKIAIN